MTQYKRFIPVICTVILLLQPPLYAKDYNIPAGISYSGSSEFTTLQNDVRETKIWFGVTGSVGYSVLHLDDEVSPEYFTSETYEFIPDPYLTIGAGILWYPKILPANFALKVDLLYAKYSYGSFRSEITDSLLNKADVDAEGLKVPISVRYVFPVGSTKIRPYLSGGYSIMFFTLTEADFASKYLQDGEYQIIEETEEFDFSKVQNTLFISAGVDFEIWKTILEIDLGAELGDGIHADKFGSSFLKTSRTQSIYLKMSLFF